MSIILDKDSKVLVQGFTGSQGTFHAKQCIEYGTQIVAGVTPAAAARPTSTARLQHGARTRFRNTGAFVSMILVRLRMRGFHHGSRGRRLLGRHLHHRGHSDHGHGQGQALHPAGGALRREITLIGPNCPGVITPGQCKVGIMPAFIHKPGSIGVVSRSGTLTYEAVDQLTKRGFGQSTVVGIAETRSTARTSPTSSPSSRRTRRPTPSS